MKPIAETIFITLLGGLLFTVLQVPLSWMLGPMSAVLLWTAVTRRKLTWPPWMRSAGLLLLGYSLGLSFTLESAQQIYTQLPYMLAATVLTIGFSLLMALLIARRSGTSIASSVIGSIPGGLSQMVVLGDEIEGADVGVVAFMQTLRLLLVVFMIPFLAVHGLAGGVTDVAGGIDDPAGIAAFLHSLTSWMDAILNRPLHSLLLAAGVAVSCWVAVKLHFPTSYFLGSIIAAALFTVFGTEPPPLPTLLAYAAQWGLGTYMGLGIKLNSLRNWKTLLPYTILSNVALIGFTLVLSFVFSGLLPMSLLTAFLGMSPGGMAEMGVTAHLVGADVSVVVTYQLFRILFILFVVPFALRRGFAYWMRRKH